jgi:hypothetical protein
MGADPYESLLIRCVPPRGGTALTFSPPPDARWDHDCPGGPKSLSCTVSLPAGVPLPTALDRMARIDVVDRRTGQVVWHGRLTDPGLRVMDDGQQQCSLTAEGMQMDLDGWREVFGLVDRARESWQAVGEFDPAQASYGGSITPGDDFDWDTDYDDLLDFGDELTIDDIDFGGDLLDGTVDFAGEDYPPNAGYEGYLGYLQDPLGGLGDMLPIPMGGDPLVDEWIEGITATDGGTSGESSTGLTISSGPGMGAFTARRRGDDLATMFIGGSWDPDGMGGLVPVGTPNIIKSAIAQFRLRTSDATAEMWVWTDTGAFNRGWFVRLDTSGTLGLYECISGTSTLIASASKTLAAGTLYEIRVSPASLLVAVEPAGTFPHDESIIDWRWWNIWLDINGFSSADPDEFLQAVDDGDALYVALGARGTDVQVAWSAFEVMRDLDDPYPGD